MSAGVAAGGKTVVDRARTKLKVTVESRRHTRLEGTEKLESVAWKEWPLKANRISNRLGNSPMLN